MQQSAPTETVKIAGVSVPSLGLGTWQMSGDECERGVAHALSIGYRHLDTAQMYENEREVGRAVTASGVDRDDIFLTTKLATDSLRADRVGPALDHSLRALDTGYVDLLLIHWPSDEAPLEETLDAMEIVRGAGKARLLGVSNFPPSLFERACTHADIFCNQVEYHPFLAQGPLLESVRDSGRLLTAYCPLARGRVTGDDTLADIGREHGKSAAQVALRWLLQQGVAPIPKASSERHREQNLNVFDFTLDDDEMERVTALGGDDRIIDPEWAPDWERP
ncbi:MAG: aldo/keto reductase [Phycisphaerales bacterium JB040]